VVIGEGGLVASKIKEDAQEGLRGINLFPNTYLGKWHWGEEGQEHQLKVGKTWAQSKVRRSLRNGQKIVFGGDARESVSPG